MMGWDGMCLLLGSFMLRKKTFVYLMYFFLFSQLKNVCRLPPLPFLLLSSITEAIGGGIKGGVE